MANDISYFKVQGDDTQYSFNDADLETRIGAEEMGTTARTVTGAIAELADKVGENTTDIADNASAIGTLSNLTTSAKGSLVVAINEVNAYADTNASAISSLNSNSSLSITRTSNNYVDATSFARLYAFKRGNMLYLNGNLNISSFPSAMSDFVEIGRISGWHAVSNAYITVPGQSNGSKVLSVSVGNSGVIKIYSTDLSAGMFHRFFICVPST